MSEKTSAMLQPPTRRERGVSIHVRCVFPESNGEASDGLNRAYDKTDGRVWRTNGEQTNDALVQNHGGWCATGRGWMRIIRIVRVAVTLIRRVGSSEAVFDHLGNKACAKWGLPPVNDARCYIACCNAEKKKKVVARSWVVRVAVQNAVVSLAKQCGALLKQR